LGECQDIPPRGRLVEGGRGGCRGGGGGGSTGWWGYGRRRVGGKPSGTGTNGEGGDGWGNAAANGTGPPKQGWGNALEVVVCSVLGGRAAGIARPVTLSLEAGAASTLRKPRQQEGVARASSQPHARSGSLLGTFLSRSVASPGRVEVLSEPRIRDLDRDHSAKDIAETSHIASCGVQR